MRSNLFSKKLKRINVLDDKPGKLGAKRTTTTTPTGSIYAEPQSEEGNIDPDSEL